MADLSLFRASPRLIRELTLDVLIAGLVPFIQSSPGLGKSSIIRSIAKELNLYLIDHRLSTSPPEDLSGLPRFDEKGFARFAPFADLFPLEGAKIPLNKEGQPYNGWLLFLDEFNSAKKETQAAAYKLILDRQVGQHSLHENCLVACAGNLATDRAIVNNLGSAMQSRVVHLEMEANFQDWFEDVAIAENYDPRIMAYLSQYQDRLMDFRPDHKDKTFCCPRTWEFMNRLVKDKAITDKKAPMYAGTITAGVAADFIQFVKVYADMPRVADIRSDPLNYRLPNDANTRWAVTTALLTSITKENFKASHQYMDRMDISFRVIFYRGVLAKNPAIREMPEFTQAVAGIAKYLRS